MQVIRFFNPLKIRIEDMELAAEIGFSKQLGIGFNILGRKDIFEKFRICFEETEKTVEFAPTGSQK